MMSARVFLILISFLLLVPSLVPSAAQAQLFTGPISSATGGAGRAAVDPSESSFLNPASVAHLRRYYLSGGYSSLHHPAYGDGYEFYGQIADGTPGNLIPGAFSYVRRFVERAGVGDTQQDLQLGIAGFAMDKLSLGISAHRLTDQFASGTEYNQINGTAGLLYTPIEEVGIALVGYDLLPASDSVPVELQTIPKIALGGHLIVLEMFRFRLDLVRPTRQNPGGRNNVHAGIETYFRKDFAFRLGGEWRETADQTYITTGFGYAGPRLSFNYSFQKDTRTDAGTRHLIDLWLPL